MILHGWILDRFLLAGSLAFLRDHILLIHVTSGGYMNYLEDVVRLEDASGLAGA